MNMTRLSKTWMKGHTPQILAANGKAANKPDEPAQMMCPLLTSMPIHLQADQWSDHLGIPTWDDRVTWNSGTRCAIHAPPVMTSRPALYLVLSVCTITSCVLGSTHQPQARSCKCTWAPCCRAAAMWAAMHRSEAKMPPCGWNNACTWSGHTSHWLW